MGSARFYLPNRKRGPLTGGTWFASGALATEAAGENPSLARGTFTSIFLRGFLGGTGRAAKFYQVFPPTSIDIKRWLFFLDLLILMDGEQMGGGEGTGRPPEILVMIPDTLGHKHQVRISFALRANTSQQLQLLFGVNGEADPGGTTPPNPPRVTLWLGRDVSRDRPGKKTLMSRPHPYPRTRKAGERLPSAEQPLKPHRGGKPSHFTDEAREAPGGWASAARWESSSGTPGYVHQGG